MPRAFFNKKKRKLKLNSSRDPVIVCETLKAVKIPLRAVVRYSTPKMKNKTILVMLKEIKSEVIKKTKIKSNIRKWPSWEKQNCFRFDSDARAIGDV